MIKIKKNQILKISEIELNDKYYVRTKLNENLIREYAESMDKGNVFPNIDISLFKKRYILIDGRHRVEAQKQRGEKYIQADVRDNFTDMSEIFIASVRANEKHGLRLGQADKLKIAYTMQEMDFDIKDINELTGISVNKIEREVLSKIRKVKIIEEIREGRKPPVIKEKIKGKEEIEIFDRKEEKKLREEHKVQWQLDELNEIYDYLKSEEFDLGFNKICKMISKIKKLLKKRFPKL